MQELSLCPPEATSIKLNLPDGRSITVDAMDVDDMLLEAYESKPKSSEVLDAFINVFEKHHQVRISKVSADTLIRLKHELIESAKKNISVTPELTDSSTPTSPSRKGTSNSSRSSSTDSVTTRRFSRLRKPIGTSTPIWVNGVQPSMTVPSGTSSWIS